MLHLLQTAGYRVEMTVVKTPTIYKKLVNSGPKIPPFDWDAIAAAAPYCTVKELAKRAGVAEETLVKHATLHFRKPFTAWVESLKFDNIVEARKKVWELAKEGDKTMLAIVAKSKAGFNDKLEVTGDIQNPISIQMLPIVNHTLSQYQEETNEINEISDLTSEQWVLKDVNDVE